MPRAWMPLIVCLLLAWTVMPQWASAQPQLTAPELLADAGLHEVFFLDAERGWAVGDRGAIWHTRDGGRHWQAQTSPVGCRLGGVWFVDEQTGYIVGGTTHAYTHHSTGVVLRTTNGGAQWNRVEGLVLPALHRVRFFSPQNGWALGDSSALYPSGLFTTNDAGRGFNPVPGLNLAGATAAACLDAQRCAVVNHAGEFVLCNAAGLERKQALPATGLARVRAMHVAGNNFWLVGEGGLLIHSSDAGRTWRRLALPLPPSAAEQWDLRAISGRGSALYVVGDPGSLVLRSLDAGQTWTIQRTGETLPLNAVSFVNEQHGWAVGEAGIILHSRDGGATWRRQHSPIQRAALLAVVGEAERTPVEWLAKYAGDEGYVAAVEALFRRDLEGTPQNIAPMRDRWRQAVSELGGAASHEAWQFPLRQVGLESTAAATAAGWGVEEARATDRLEQYLVRRLRTWRPEVVLCEPANDAVPAQRWLRAALLSAATRANDPEAWPEQITALALPAWAPRKVAAQVATGNGSVNLALAQVSLQRGSSLADQAKAAQSMWQADFPTVPESSSLKLLLDRTGDANARRDLFQGLNLVPGGGLRRAAGNPDLVNLGDVRRFGEERRWLNAALAAAAESNFDLAVWWSKFVASALAPRTEVSPSTLYELGCRLAASGKMELAAAVFMAHLDRWPHDVHAAPILTTLIPYYASAEQAWRLRMLPADTQLASVATTARQLLPASTGLPAAPAANPAISFDAPPASPRTLEERFQRAVDLAERFERTHPELHARPQTRFSLCAAQRGLRNDQAARALWEGLAAQRGGDAWRGCALAEQWLLQATPTAGKVLATCGRSASAPRLDGRLDEAWWSTAATLDCRSEFRDDASWPCRANIAADDKFLYLAVQCTKAPGVKYAPAGARQRDADCTQFDRVELYFDTDRDYASWWRFTIDHRGWASDDCTGDRSWNPNWFVAVHDEAASWICEAAIPWEAIASTAPTTGQAWAINVQRIVPEAGFQSWSRPAGINVRPEGFGLLSFGR